jgi:hypothetical protein
LQRLGAPDATAVAHSRLCGSGVTVDLNMKDVVPTSGEVKAAPGRASSSVMAHVVGSTAELRPERPDVCHAEKTGPAPRQMGGLQALSGARFQGERTPHAPDLRCCNGCHSQIEAEKAHDKPSWTQTSTRTNGLPPEFARLSGRGKNGLGTPLASPSTE